MRILFVSLTLLLASCGPAASVKIKAITGATLINGNGGAPIADSVVIVTDSTITAAGPRASTPIPSRAETIDATGQYLLPGLMDMHVHLGTRGGPGFDAKDYTSDRIVKNLNAYLYFGVTTVRSVAVLSIGRSLSRPSCLPRGTTLTGTRPWAWRFTIPFIIRGVGKSIRGTAIMLTIGNRIPFIRHLPTGSRTGWWPVTSPTDTRCR